MREQMKFVFNFSMFLMAFFLFSNESFSLSDYKIKKLCKNEERELTCIKNFQEKKTNLQKGNQIEIPVLPYKK